MHQSGSIFTFEGNVLYVAAIAAVSRSPSKMGKSNKYASTFFPKKGLVIIVMLAVFTAVQRECH